MNVLKKYNKQIRFLIVGGTSTLIDYILYMLLSIRLDVSISKLISMLCASIFSYINNKNWTFSNKEKTNTIMIIKYVGSQIVNISVNILVNAIMYKLLVIKTIVFIFATGTAMVVNYLLQNYIVFKGGKK